MPSLFTWLYGRPQKGSDMKNTRAILKFIFFILLLLAAMELLRGQQNTSLFRIGYNHSTVWSPRDDQPERIPIPGMYLGAGYTHYFTRAAFRGELLLSSRGFLSQSVGDTYIHNLILYLDLPVGIQKKLAGAGMWDLCFNGGLTLSYKILAINLISEIDGIRSIDPSIFIGPALHFGKLAFELRYNHGLINMDLLSGPAYNRSLSVGIRFTFKGE